MFSCTGNSNQFANSTICNPRCVTHDFYQLHKPLSWYTISKDKKVATKNFAGEANARRMEISISWNRDQITEQIVMQGAN
jgi:hypothetical protein